MSSTTPYRPLGQFIRPIDKRNRDGLVTNLLGVSVNKCFIPSVANTIGTDMSKYKVIRKGQFVYIPDTSRRGDKIALAYNKDNECIVSQAYIVFEVSDTECLLPEYMMLWFLRPEFDRYARFYSHGSAREVFDWETLCATCIPVPPITEQTRIVSQFATLEKRISLCKARISLLERTASALYRKTFVEGIDRNNLPAGWRMGTLGEVAEVSSGKSLADKKDKASGLYCIPVAGASGIIGYTRKSNQTERILTTGRVGTIGVVKKYDGDIWTADNVLVVKSPFYEYCYQLLLSFPYELIIQGGVQSLITQSNLSSFSVLVPPISTLTRWEKQTSVISCQINNLERQLSCLERTKGLLLTQIK